jgi:hypothetical protein
MAVGVVTTRQGRDIGPTINRLMANEQADAQGFLALLLAESNLDEMARRPVRPVDDLAYWPDVSGGIAQQTVRFAPIGDQSPSRTNIDAVMARLFEVDYALDLAAAQYGHYYRQTGDWQEACAKYNGGPFATWHTIPAANRANYARAYTEAAAYLGDTAPAPAPDEVALRQRYLRHLEVNTGTPYVFGGKVPGAYDCSGLLTDTAQRMGLNLGDPMLTSADGLKQYCDPIDPAEALPGDLLPRMFAAAPVPEPIPGPPPEPPASDPLTDLVNLIGYMKGDVADALQAALDGVRAARTKAERERALDALQAALDTLKTAGET